MYYYAMTYRKLSCYYQPLEVTDEKYYFKPTKCDIFGFEPFLSVALLGHNFDIKYYNQKFRSGKTLPNSGKTSNREHGVRSFTLRTLKSDLNLLMMLSE